MKKILSIIFSSAIFVLGILYFVESIQGFNQLSSLVGAEMRVQVDIAFMGAFELFFALISIFVFVASFIFIFKKKDEQKALDISTIGLACYAISFAVICFFYSDFYHAVNPTVKNGLPCSAGTFAILAGVALVLAEIKPIKESVRKILPIIGAGLLEAGLIVSCFLLTVEEPLGIVTATISILVSIFAIYVYVKAREGAKQ